MPVVARFCGIVIRMLRLGVLGARLHAFHGNQELVIDLADLRVIEGDLPGQLPSLVLAWAQLNRDYLLARYACGPRRRPALAPAA